MTVHQNSVFANSFHTNLHFQRLGFLIGEHSDNKKVPIPWHLGSSRFMPIFILVEKVVLLVCTKSVLIMSFPARTINKTPLNKTSSNSILVSNICVADVLQCNRLLLWPFCYHCRSVNRRVDMILTLPQIVYKYTPFPEME